MIARRAPHPYPNGTRQGDVGYLVLEVPDLDAAMSFYGPLLGWTFRPGNTEQGRQVDGVAPMMGMAGGASPGGLVVCWRVDDIAAAIARVQAAGGTAEEPETQPTGTRTSAVDDQGAPFYLWQPPDERATAERVVPADERPRHGAGPGDISYLTLEVKDADRARAFYGTVLEWIFHSNHGEDPDDTMPMIGIWGGCDRPVAVPMYDVDDVAATAARVRAAGGRAGEPVRKPYGLTAECADDQGIRFYLGQH